MKLFFQTIYIAVLLLAPVQILASTSSSSNDSTHGEAAKDSTAPNNAKVHWRDDVSVRRRPASYVGGALNYAQLRTWLSANDDHKALAFGPIHTFATVFRVGDALTDKFCLGFQIQWLNGKDNKKQISAFALLLDMTFYPYKGLGIRPSAGFGFGFAQGENKWEFGFGGPGTLSFSLLYEFRLTKKLTLAPVAQTTWLTGDEYEGFFTLFGVEMLFWPANKNRYKY